MSASTGDVDTPPVAQSPMRKVYNFMLGMLDGPADWIRENIVEPNRGEKYYWYHKKFPRAVPIDECYVDDYMCIYEADMEFKRRRRVDTEILRILRGRVNDCALWNRGKHGDYGMYYCDDLEKDFQEAELSYFIKYGEMVGWCNVAHVYTKQKHRMIWERRKALREAQEQQQQLQVNSE